MEQKIKAVDRGVDVEMGVTTYCAMKLFNPNPEISEGGANDCNLQNAFGNLMDLLVKKKIIDIDDVERVL